MRLTRSSSQSSSSETDSPVHKERPPYKDVQQEEKVTEVQDQPAPVSGKSFFATLHWEGQGSGGQNSDAPTTQPKSLFDVETEQGLLDDASDDDEDFAVLSHDRNKDEQKQKQVNGMSSMQADLLNIHSSPSHVERDVDLLNINEPSNVDLLGGSDAGGAAFETFSNASTVNKSDTFDPFQNLGASGAPSTQTTNHSQSTADTFDPFQNLGSTASSQAQVPDSNTFDPFQNFKSSSGSTKEEHKPKASAAQKGGLGAFDPFGNTDTSSSNTFDPFSQIQSEPTTKHKKKDEFLAFMESKSDTSNDDEPNLMGNWATPTINLPGGTAQQKSATNLTKSSSASNFQQQYPGANIPRNNSGTFSNAGLGAQYQKAGGHEAGFGSTGNIAPQQKADPFADLGKITVKLSFFVCFLF